MPEYSGSLQSFELAVLLWLVPLLPLAAAVYAKTFGARLARDTERKSENKALEPTLVCLALALACTAILALSTADLAFASAGRRQLLSHAWNLVRIGSLDANLMLCLDPATAIASLGVTLGAVFALYWCRTSELAEDARRSLSAAVSFGLAGIQLVLLGDDWVLVLAGALIAALSTLGLVGRGARGFVLARVGDAAIVLGAVVLTWGLGGSFTGARDYVPAYRAPLIAAQVGSPTSKEAARERPGSGTGFLSMAAFPGAELSMGGAALCRIDADGKPGGVGLPGRACREAARPPFAQLELPTGLQDVLVNPGPGQSELLVDKLRVNAGRETLIMPSGATISLREGRNQLRVEDPSGERVLAGELGKWRLLGIPIFALVSGLFLFGAAWRGLVVPLARSGSEPAESSLAAAVIVAALADFVVGAAILLRVGFVFEFAPRVSSVAAGVLALFTIFAFARAAHALDVRRAFSLIAVGAIGNALIGVASGALVDAAVWIAVQALALAAFGFALTFTGVDGSLELEAGRAAKMQKLARVSQLACVAIAGAPIPAVGAFWPRDATVQALASGVGSGAITSWVSCVLAALAGGVLAFAVFRLHYLVFVGKTERSGASPGAPLLRALSGLALFALALGAVAFGARRLGIDLPSPLDGFAAAADEGTRTLELDVRRALVLVGYVPALAGWALARRRYAIARSDDWFADEARRIGHGLLAREPRVWYDVALLQPAKALGRWLGDLDLAIETAAFGALPSDAPESTDATAEPMPEPEPQKKKKKKKKRAGGGE